MNATKKRKIDSSRADDSAKRLKMSSAAVPSTLPLQHPSKPSPLGTKNVPEEKTKEKDAKTSEVKDNEKNTETSKGKETEKNTIIQSQSNKTRRRINKLAPPRPFPTVPTSVSDTGPRSGHREGKNMVCLTRKTSLGNYMRRCKDVILVDGYKTLHLSAMGAAIPLLTQLICALPPILPFPRDEIHMDIRTGTVEVQDEVLPDDEDEDLTYQTRGKSVLRVVFKIGDGEFEGDKTASRNFSAGKTVGKVYNRPGGNNNGNKKEKAKPSVESSEVVYEEPEQVFMDTI